ncbi:transcription elongation factor Spt5 [Candidatus Woesearchaeota archaeon]|nr:transcription elongation factor Spt5 [Candidatus Woesearchaeota archaeon]
MADQDTKEQDNEFNTKIFALRTSANREDQVMDFVASHVKQKKLPVYALIFPHGTKGYIFVEAGDRQSAEQAAYGVPYARGILPKEVQFKEIEHMLEVTKKVRNIRINDIVEIIAGPLKREQAKIVRIDQQKGEVVVHLLTAPVPMPLTMKTDAVKVIRREHDDDEEE